MSARQLAGAALAALALFAAGYATRLALSRGAATLAAGTLYDVVDVPDADALVLAGGVEVQLLGLVTPGSGARGAIAPGGLAAKRFARELLEGRRVMLWPDAGDALRATGGRVAAYVFREDDTDVNLLLLELGHARVDRDASFARRAEFLRAEASW